VKLNKISEVALKKARGRPRMSLLAEEKDEEVEKAKAAFAKSARGTDPLRRQRTWGRLRVCASNFECDWYAVSLSTLIGC
jgi:hypothetical protein